MAIFLIATGPAFALLGQLNQWPADRKHALLVPKLEVSSFPLSAVTYPCNRTEHKYSKAKIRGYISRAQGLGHRPNHPPII